MDLLNFPEQNPAVKEMTRVNLPGKPAWSVLTVDKPMLVSVA